MKSIIVGIESRGIKTCIRIINNSSSQNNYTKFRQELIDKFKINVKGHSGCTELIGDGIDINVVNAEKYLCFILYLDPKLKNQIMEILIKYFEFIKPK